MSKYQYILLDWDGNLAKTLDIWLEACHAPLIKRGVHLSDEEIAASFGAFSAHIKQWGFGDEIDEFLSEADEIAKSKLPNVELYPDALEVLEELKVQGKKLALITTSPHENIEHLLQKYDMLRLFDVLIASDDVSHHKPHPEPLEKALEKLNGTKDKAVMVGDSDKDLGAAQNAKIDSILFYPPEHKKFYDIEKLKKHNPAHIIDDFRQLLNLV